MTVKQRARSVTGLLAACTLIGLVAADTLHPSVALSIEDKVLLGSMASGLLGFDLVLDRVSLAGLRRSISSVSFTIETDQGDDDE